MNGEIFKVGDLVQYAPYFSDEEGPWVMQAELGIVIKVRHSGDFDKYQIVTVRWISNGEISVVDMAMDVLKKISLDKPTQT